MFACAKRDCRKPAEWEPELVFVKSDAEVRVGIPVPVCTEHRRGFRALLLGGGVPGAESALAERALDVRAAIRIQFTALN